MKLVDFKNLPNGSTFDLGNVKLKVTEDARGGCGSCHIVNIDDKITSYAGRCSGGMTNCEFLQCLGILPYCDKDKRKDGKNVSFVEVEKDEDYYDEDDTDLLRDQLKIKGSTIFKLSDFVRGVLDKKILSDDYPDARLYDEHGVYLDEDPFRLVSMLEIYEDDKEYEGEDNGGIRVRDQFDTIIPLRSYIEDRYSVDFDKSIVLLWGEWRGRNEE